MARRVLPPQRGPRPGDFAIACYALRLATTGAERDEFEALAESGDVEGMTRVACSLPHNDLTSRALHALEGETNVRRRISR